MKLEQIIGFYQQHAQAAANGMSVNWQEVGARMTTDLTVLAQEQAQVAQLQEKSDELIKALEAAAVEKDEQIKALGAIIQQCVDDKMLELDSLDADIAAATRKILERWGVTVPAAPEG